MITGAAKVLAKPIASVNNTVPLKNPTQVGMRDRMIIPVDNNVIITIRMFSRPKRLPMVGAISAPKANVSMGTAPSHPSLVSEIARASCTIGAIEPSATMGARILTPNKTMANSTSQKVKREEGRLKADGGFFCDGFFKFGEMDIAARRLFKRRNKHVITPCRRNITGKISLAKTTPENLH